VNAADPSRGALGTTLDVRVLGQNFTSGAKVTFLLNGSATAFIKTNSTRFVNATELVANITIDEAASLDLYDIQVLAGKKPGVGIELFEVVGATALLPVNPGTGAAGLFEDGLGLYDRGGLGDSPWPTGHFNLQPSCERGRSFVVVLPPAWQADLPPQTERISTCDEDNGWQRALFHIPELEFADCVDGATCPIGGPHVPGTGFGNDLVYYFQVDNNGDGVFSPNGKAKEASYNVVWIDARYAVLARGTDGVTPCRWHVTGGTAQFWKRGDTPLDVAGSSIALNAVITRRNGPCPL
jgi:hypothetical protein